MTEQDLIDLVLQFDGRTETTYDANGIHTEITISASALVLLIEALLKPKEKPAIDLVQVAIDAGILDAKTQELTDRYKQ